MCYLELASCLVCVCGEEVIEGSRVLVVGTGGIGCELLKNLVLTGFRDIVAVITSHADRPVVGL